MRRALQGLVWLSLLAICQCASAHPDATAPEAGSGKREQRDLPSVAADAGVSTKQPAPAGANGEAGRAGSAGRTAPTMKPSAGRSGAAGSGAAGSSPDVDADAGSAPAADGGQAPPSLDESACLSGIDDYADPGPFEYRAEAMQKLKAWVPKVPTGCKVPVVHFANGTGATCSNYQPVLERLASHGFLTVCAENTNTGSGTLGVEAFQAALELYPDVATRRFGSAGHHAGGQGAILTLQQWEAAFGSRGVYAGLAFAPATGFGAQPPSGSWQDAYATVKSPVLLVSGTADQLISESSVGNGFTALSDSIEAYWYSAVGAVHIPVPVAPMQEAAIAWFRWKLLDDARACAYFKRMPEGDRWDARGEQHAVDCQ